MPKKVFWPAALVVMGFVILSTNLGLLPATFWNLWPIIVIVVGLGGLLTADRNEWLVSHKPKKVSKKRTTKKAAKSRTARPKKK